MTHVDEGLLADELASYHEKECNRYQNGTCMTLRCMRRSGYKAGEIPDYEKATCESHETALLLRALRAPPPEAGVREALEKIAKLYIDAPGWANPTPTTELVWGMYSIARDALRSSPPQTAEREEMVSEQTAAGIINWKVEADRANRLLAIAEKRLADLTPSPRHHNLDGWVLTKEPMWDSSEPLYASPPVSEASRNERRVERIEHIAAIILDEYKTNSQGMLTNSHDLARMIADTPLRSPQEVNAIVAGLPRIEK